MTSLSLLLETAVQTAAVGLERQEDFTTSGAALQMSFKGCLRALVCACPGVSSDCTDLDLHNKLRPCLGIPFFKTEIECTSLLGQI